MSSRIRKNGITLKPALNRWIEHDGNDGDKTDCCVKIPEFTYILF